MPSIAQLVERWTVGECALRTSIGRCFGMTRRKRKTARKTVSRSKPNGSKLATAEKIRLKCRRREEFHDTFLSYAKIAEFLDKTKKENPGRVQVVQIGRSGKGKSILMVTVTAAAADHAKMAVVVTAGLSGSDYMAVSNALYLVYHLAKNPNSCRLLNYHVIPCSNPDAYDAALRPENRPDPSHPVDLTRNYPVLLGLGDLRSVPTGTFLGKCSKWRAIRSFVSGRVADKIKSWKENFRPGCPESRAVLAVLYAYKFAVKLFVSLEGGGQRVCYPPGDSPGAAVNDLAAVARKGTMAVKRRCFEHGSVYEMLGLTYGTAVDFLRVDAPSLKFCYIVQVAERRGAVQDSKMIVSYGEDMVECVAAMARAVHKFYAKPVAAGKKIETRVKNIFRK
ncbi:uncharacterized protein LOC132700109 [Cylas formicarius]|uniref:uncharacterized protein LOC132700109 n=1 Tax=Cylas formicarius TaxID=197179 RepID=UPI00295847D7|nr:uncharacterized protein LOC132700109 [Cylas formicarius]